MNSPRAYPPPSLTCHICCWGTPPLTFSSRQGRTPKDRKRCTAASRTGRRYINMITCFSPRASGDLRLPQMCSPISQISKGFSPQMIGPSEKQNALNLLRDVTAPAGSVRRITSFLAPFPAALSRCLTFVANASAQEPFAEVAMGHAGPCSKVDSRCRAFHEVNHRANL